MANVNSPFGFRLFSMLSGTIQNVSIRRYRVPAAVTSPIFVGDPVERYPGSSVMSGTNPSLNQEPGLEYVQRATGISGDQMLGVVVGVCWNPTNLTSTFSVGGVDRDIMVCDDPNAIYEIQSDINGVTPLQLGNNCLVSGLSNGNPLTGTSGAVVTGAANNKLYPLLIMGWSQDQNNDITSVPYVRVLVRINSQQLTMSAGAGALGV